MRTSKALLLITYAVLLNFLLFACAAYAAVHALQGMHLAQQFLQQFHQAVISGVQAGK